MNKLRVLFTSTIAISLIIIVIASTLIASTINKRSIEEESRRLLTTTANYSALQLENKLNHFKGQVETVRLSIESHATLLTDDKFENMDHLLYDFEPTIKALNEENTESIAAYLVFNHNEYTLDSQYYTNQIVYVKDNDNNNNLTQTNITNEDLDSQSAHMSWYYAPIQNRQGVWSDIYYDDYVKDTIITYSTPIIHNNTVIAIIGLDIKFSEFSQIVSDIKVYETGYAFLMAENLDYLVHPILAYNENLATIQEGAYAYMTELFLENPTGTIKYFFDDKDKILAFSHLDNGWIIAVAPPYEEVFYFYNDLRNTQVLILLLGSIVSIIIAYIVGYYISKPFQKVATDIEDITSQDLLASYVDDKHFIYEVDIIYKNFNSFSKRLGEAFQSISEQNKNLEHLVDERTLDLKESNKQLLHYITQLETTQDLLVKAKKDQEINNLIKNIAHNLNTPLGTAITTYSYLKRIIHPENKKAIMALGIIDNNLHDMKRIIDGLNLLTSDHKATTDSLISFKTLIDSRVNWLRIQNVSLNISCHLVQLEDYNCFSNKNMLVNLFDIIFSYGIHHYELTDINFNIEVRQDDDGFTIVFVDGITPIDDLLEFYDQSNINSMSISNFDLDLHLLHAVVEALDGHITLEATKLDYVKWIIHINKA